MQSFLKLLSTSLQSYSLRAILTLLTSSISGLSTHPPYPPSFAVLDILSSLILSLVKMDPLATRTGADPSASPFESPQAMPQLQLLDFFFPGFSVFSTAVQRYLGFDLNVYIPLVLLCGGMTFAWQYFSEYFWGVVETHLMSSVEIRTEDEIYNVVMSWVAAQRFAQGARRFVVNTNLNSRSWFLWRWDNDEDDEEGEYDGEQSGPGTAEEEGLVVYSLVRVAHLLV